MGTLCNTHVIVVAGPPGAGKSTYVKERWKPGDLVVDLDAMREALTLVSDRDVGIELTKYALDAHTAVLRRLMTGQIQRAWIIGCYPLQKAREQFRQRYGAQVVVLEHHRDICNERIEKDILAGIRTSHVNWHSLVADWWSTYERDPRDFHVTGDASKDFSLSPPQRRRA